MEAEDVCQPETFMHLFNSQLEAVVCVVFTTNWIFPVFSIVNSILLWEKARVKKHESQH